MNELEDTVDADEGDLDTDGVLLPSEQILIDLLAEGKTLPEAALNAFPLKDDPVRFATFRLKKRDLYRSCVLAYGDERFSDFQIIDKYATILNGEEDTVVHLKALKDYSEFRKSFTHEPKTTAIIEVDAAGVINQQTVNNFFSNPSPSATMNSVLIPKEQIYAKRNRVHNQDTQQRSTIEREGDVGVTSKADPE